VSKKRLSSKERRKLRIFICRRDDYKCAYCGKNLLRSFEDFMLSSLEHKTPIACGGTNDYKNLCCSCVVCNALKGDFRGNLKETKKYIETRKIEFQTLYRSELTIKRGIKILLCKILGL